MTWRAILKSNFKDAVFGRHLALFKKRVNRLTGNAFGPPINKKYRRQAADMAFSMLDEAVASNDTERQEEILNDLYYGEAGKKIKELYDITGVNTFKTFMAYLRSFVAEQFPRAKNDTVNEVISIDGTFNKSFKETVFNTDRDLIEFKRELKDIKQDEIERDLKIVNSSKSLPTLQDVSFREKKRLLITIEHIEDYLNNHLRQYPVLNEQQKIGVVDWFTKDSIMNALKRYKTRYIRKLANFLYDKYGAIIPTSKLDEMNITERAFIPLEKSFKETVFANEGGNRELRKLKEELNVILSFLEEDYHRMLMAELHERRKELEYGGEFDEDGNYYSYADGEKEPPSMKVKDVQKVIRNIAEEFKQQIPLIIAEIEAIDREEDNNKKLELIDDIIYPLDFKGTGKLPNGAAIAIVEYLEERYTQENTEQAKAIKQKLGRN